MREYFRGWRRKAGLATIVIACVFATGWVNSFERFYDVTFQISPEIRDTFVSAGGALWWGRIHRGEHTEFIQDPLTHLFSVHRPYKFRWKWMGFDFYEMDDNGANLRNKVVVVPYWSLVLPPAGLSGYFLLSKPRQKLSAPSQDVHQ